MLMPQSRVRFIGSRELHRDLPKVLESLENPDARYVLTIHSKPKAVLIGAEAFLALLRGYSAEDRLLALQLGALVQGLESGGGSEDEDEAAATAAPRKVDTALVGV
jgi:PHD/YefM family antitoxin component YafN of YafNO toxin-antitoxin module